MKLKGNNLVHHQWHDLDFTYQRTANIGTDYRYLDMMACDEKLNESTKPDIARLKTGTGSGFALACPAKVFATPPECDTKRWDSLLSLLYYRYHLLVANPP